MKRRFNSIEEVNNELRILDAQREIHYHKIFQSVDILKDNLTPQNLVKTAFASAISYFKGSENVKRYLATTIIGFLAKKLFKK